MTNLALQAGNPPLAETILNTALIVKPRSAQIYDALGFIQSQQGKNPEAEVTFRQAIALDENNSRAHNNLGVVLLMLEEPKAAVEQLEKATQLDPGNAAQYYNLANAYLASGEGGRAAESYRLAYQLDPGLVDANAHQAAVMLIEGQPSEAEAVFKQILLTEPNHALSLRSLGVIAYQNSEFSGELGYLQKAQTIDPFDPFTRFFAGITMERLGRLAEAGAELERALFLSSYPELSRQIEVHLRTVRESQGDG